MTCKKCRLWRTRKNIVKGRGFKGAQAVFVGEGPGREEDEVGIPFVGRSGKLIRKVCKRFKIIPFFTNTVCCRPPNNRDPLADEIKACRKRLFRTLDSHPAKLVVAVGRFAADVIWKGSKERTELIWHWELPFKWHKKYVFSIRHPAFYLRQGNPKGFADEMKRVKSFLKHIERGGVNCEKIGKDS